MGDARIGVAVSDASGALAVPVETIAAHPKGRAMQQIVKMAEERDALEIVVGLPRNMSGSEGPAAKKVRRFAAQLARRLPGVRVCLIDERLSTVQGQSRLHSMGVDTKQGRSVIDQVAAQIILEQALEQERQSGEAPGQLVTQRAEELEMGQG